MRARNAEGPLQEDLLALEGPRRLNLEPELGSVLDEGEEQRKKGQHGPSLGQPPHLTHLLPHLTGG
jgi:hypothetical protein